MEIMGDIKITPGENISIIAGKITLAATVNERGDLNISTTDSKTHVSTHHQAGKIDISIWNL